MGDNSLLLIIFAFILGCMSKNMMKQMCGYNLVEGNVSIVQPDDITYVTHTKSNNTNYNIAQSIIHGGEDEMKSWVSPEEQMYGVVGHVADSYWNVPV